MCIPFSLRTLLYEGCPRLHVKVLRNVLVSRVAPQSSAHMGSMVVWKSAGECGDNVSASCVAGHPVLSCIAASWLTVGS